MGNIRCILIVGSALIETPHVRISRTGINKVWIYIMFRSGDPYGGIRLPSEYCSAAGVVPAFTSDPAQRIQAICVQRRVLMTLSNAFGCLGKVHGYSKDTHVRLSRNGKSPLHLSIDGCFSWFCCSEERK